ncbi:MAG: hypothetical protein JWP27_1348 [Flaviaesturariibacter sp.]|nr:hypothetical protein [Flaviaesturariibacter sp.]
MEQPKTLIDPFGLEVDISESLCLLPPGARSDELYNDYRKVIERPAFVIDIRVDDPPSRYYFRSIGWSVRLLIRAVASDAGWLACDCSRNPTDAELNSLAARGAILSPFME